jgi:glutamyl-tRNA synthetase
MSVRVRFSPSPTGQITINNIHAAIFNWLYARHMGGKFLIRIEDSEQEQATEESVKLAMEAMEWLKLDYDEDPMDQATRINIHLLSANQLIETGMAYKSTTGQGGESIILCLPAQDVAFRDVIRGELRKPAKDITDFVIVRSNGTPVNHLAEVVDDIKMGITHVIRGEEHIDDTYRQVAIFKALGAEPPAYAHLPTIVNHQGKPYSKRDGAATVGEFMDKGYLPDALFNFIALLGWSPPDDRELLSREELIDLFDIERVKPAPARMDMAKFEWMNGEYMRTAPQEEFAAGFKAALQRSGLVDENISDEYLAKVAALVQDRTKTYAEVPYFAGFFFTEEFHYDEMAVKNRIKKEGVAELLTEMKNAFTTLDVFTAAKTEEATRRIASAHSMPLSQISYPLRVAVSGLLMGPGLFEMLEVLGKERVINRLNRTLQIA